MGVEKEVQAELQSIIWLGRSWGMSEEEIKQCLLKEASANSKSKSEKNKNGNQILSWIWFSIKLGVILPVGLLLALFLLYSGFIALASLHPELEVATSKFLNPYVYPSMRAIRKTFKPIADRFDIAAYYNAECLVKNPYYLDPVPDCEACTKKMAVADLTGKSVAMIQNYMDDITPFVIRRHAKNPINYEALRKAFMENEQRFGSGSTIEFDSNIAGVRNASDFFRDFSTSAVAKANKGIGYVQWKTASVSSAQVIRKLFPRPEFIPQEAEVSLTKSIFIDGPLADSHELPVGAFASNWYHQASGSRLLKLWVHPDCAEQGCRMLKVRVNPGDTVYYQDQYWRIESNPSKHSSTLEEQPSIAFVSSFTF